MHACSFTFQTLILSFSPDAKRLESVREKDNAVGTTPMEKDNPLTVEKPPSERIVSACFGVRVGLSM
jgi:hypothetical protein